MSRQSPGHGSRVFRFALGWIGVSLIALAVAVTLARHGNESIEALAAEIERATPWLALWRATLIASVIGFWPRIILVLGRWYGATPEVRATYRAMRWRVALWLVLIELVIAQALPQTLIAERLG